MRTAPFTETVLEGSANTITAPSPQPLGGDLFSWTSWSSGGPASQSLIAGANATYIAEYEDTQGEATVPSPGPPRPDDEFQIKTLRERIPSTSGGLLRRGGRAKLLCNLDCHARVKLFAEGELARQLRIAGKVGAAGADLDGGVAG